MSPDLASAFMALLFVVVLLLVLGGVRRRSASELMIGTYRDRQRVLSIVPDFAIATPRRFTIRWILRSFLAMPALFMVAPVLLQREASGQAAIIILITALFCWVAWFASLGMLGGLLARQQMTDGKVSLLVAILTGFAVFAGAAAFCGHAPGWRLGLAFGCVVGMVAKWGASYGWTKTTAFVVTAAMCYAAARLVVPNSPLETHFFKGSAVHLDAFALPLAILCSTVAAVFGSLRFDSCALSELSRAKFAADHRPLN